MLSAISPQAFLGELEAAGIATSEFNLPDWEESKEGFERGLDVAAENIETCVSKCVAACQDKPSEEESLTGRLPPPVQECAP